MIAPTCRAPDRDVSWTRNYSGQLVENTNFYCGKQHAENDETK